MFTGFSPETVDFLWGIRMNNNRDWFQAHKKQYTDTLYEPMKALGQQLFEPYLDDPGSVLKVSRIYRDARLHHPLPYKESIWICIRKDSEWWGSAPCLFFEIKPEGVEYGLFLWKASTAAMETFRKRIADRPEEFLNLVRQTEEATGIPVTASLYKRPRPAPIPELERFYAWKDCIGCTQYEEVGENLFSPELGQRAADLFRKLTPLYEYLNQFCL